MTSCKSRTVLLAVLVAAGCGGSDRDAQYPDANTRGPSQAHEVSDNPVDSHEGSPDDGDTTRADDSSESGSRAPVPCGNLTCGADEYCEVKCTCCGTRIPDPSEASGSYSCLPLPPECATTSEGLCGGNRTKQIPCA